MKNIMKKTFFLMIVLGFLLILSQSVYAVVTVSKVEVSPTEPTQKTEVTFSVGVTGDDIEGVWIEIEECTDPDSDNYFCHPVYNVSAIESNGMWEATATLVYSDTAEAHCWPIVKANGTRISYKSDFTKWTNFTVAPAQDEPDGNGGDIDGDNGKTPGFELVFVMISVAAVFLIYKKKRLI